MYNSYLQLNSKKKKLKKKIIGALKYNNKINIYIIILYIGNIISYILSKIMTLNNIMGFTYIVCNQPDCIQFK